MLNGKQKLYGAALYAITQHAGYAGMTPLDDRSYLVNGQTAVYFKHATRPNPQGEYQFTFTLAEVELFDDWHRTHGAVVLALICVEGEEICCLPYEDFERLWSLRQEAAGDLEEQFWLKLILPTGKGFRVYVDCPGRRKLYLDRPVVVSRTDFPNRVFVGVPALLPA